MASAVGQSPAFHTWPTGPLSTLFPPLLCLSLLMLDGPACSQTERLSVLTSGLSHVLFPLPRDRQEHPFSKSFLARFYASFRSQLRLPRMLSLPSPLIYFRNSQTLINARGPSVCFHPAPSPGSGFERVSTSCVLKDRRNDPRDLQTDGSLLQGCE